MLRTSVAYIFGYDSYTRVEGSLGGIGVPEPPTAQVTVLAGYPKPIVGNWPGLFTSGIQAAVNWWDGNAYFFRGAEYSRYNIAADKVDDGYPALIADNWPGLFTSGIDAALNWNDGNVYFFRGAEYCRYNIAVDKVVEGPKPIAGNWPPGMITSGIWAAVDWARGSILT